MDVVVHVPKVTHSISTDKESYEAENSTVRYSPSEGLT